MRLCKILRTPCFTFRSLTVNIANLPCSSYYIITKRIRLALLLNRVTFNAARVAPLLSLSRLAVNCRSFDSPQSKYRGKRKSGSEKRGGEGGGCWPRELRRMYRPGMRLDLRFHPKHQYHPPQKNETPVRRLGGVAALHVFN